MALRHDAGLRGQQAQNAAVGNQVTGNVGLAGVAAFEQKAADRARDDDDHQGQHRKRHRPHELNTAEPCLLTSFDDLGAKQAGHGDPTDSTGMTLAYQPLTGPSSAPPPT